jgi:hypothetical protein
MDLPHSDPLGAKHVSPIVFGGSASVLRSGSETDHHGPESLLLQTLGQHGELTLRASAQLELADDEGNRDEGIRRGWVHGQNTGNKKGTPWQLAAVIVCLYTSYALVFKTGGK